MSSRTISLLFPADAAQSGAWMRLSPQCVRDLGLEEIAAAMAVPGIGSGDVLEILSTLCTDAGVIEYRQSILDDLVSNPSLVPAFEEVLPKIGEMIWYTSTHRSQGTPLLQVIWRIGELELYVECLESFHRVLSGEGDGIRSKGLRSLSEEVEARRASPDYQSLQTELPKMKEALRKRRSVTIGVNLDERLRPVEAVLVSVNEESYREQSLLSRLFGREMSASGFDTPLPLHATPRPPERSLYPTGAFPLAPLFQDLERLLHSLTRPLLSHIRKYVQINTQFLETLRPELAFFIGAMHLLDRLKTAGLHVSRPTIRPIEERTLVAHDFYNLHLALRMVEEHGSNAQREMICNDASFGEEGRIFVLTGPNQGGKTTFTQGIGILQVFGQAGLPVPAREAMLSPADQVITHFPLEEAGELEQARLAEEASRLQALFHTITDKSLILLNESLSSTSPGESVYLAEDIVSAFRIVGARAVFATHLHELAYRLEEINASVEGDSKVVSLVAGVAEKETPPGSTNGVARRTFRITPGPPIGKSYARDIAEQYGISLSRIRSSLKERGIL